VVVESAAGQVSLTGEPVAGLLVRLDRQAALIRDGEAREAAKDARIAELETAVADGSARVAALEGLVAELSRKLGVDSQNSSKPPSSDGPGTRADRRRADRERRRPEPAGGAEGEEEARRPGGSCRAGPGVHEDPGRGAGRGTVGVRRLRR
jgi:hypothetical protein